MKSVAIIGAGIGGLCTGIELLLQGYAVSIYEKTGAPGGVLRSIASPDGAYRFEESASIPINPNTYRDYLKRLGLNPNDYFHDEKLKTLYHVYYHDGSVLRVPHDAKSMRQVLQKSFGADVSGWDAFLRATMKKYEISKRYVINRPFMTLGSILNPQLLCKVVELNPFTSASRYVKRFIRSEALRDFILFQAFFMGIQPEKLPNVYTTVYANSQVEGISHIQGGLSHYVRALARIFVEKGGRLYYHAPVQDITRKGPLATGIRVGNRVERADIVVVNADYCYAQKALLHRELRRDTKPSCSTFVVHLGLTKKYPMLSVHNLFINRRFTEEVADVFRGKLPQNPSLYIYSPSCMDDSYCKNPRHSVMNLMLRVPNLKQLPILWDKSTRERLYALCLQAVASIKGLEDIEEHIAYKSVTTPMDFENRYHCRYGSCFGIGHTLLQSMAFRPQLRDKVCKNLYYVGSSVHPGNGASIVMGGAQMVSEAILRNHPIFHYDRKQE